jgi:hypothetical protein
MTIIAEAIAQTLVLVILRTLFRAAGGFEIAEFGSILP